MQYNRFIYYIISFLFLFLGYYTIQMFFYKYCNDFVKSHDNMQSIVSSPSSSPTSILTPFRISDAQRRPPFPFITAHEVGVFSEAKHEKRCKKRINAKKKVSWNPVVSVGDTYSKEEYDRRMDVVQITQNIALARIEKSLEFEFGFGDLNENDNETEQSQYRFFSFV